MRSIAALRRRVGRAEGVADPRALSRAALGDAAFDRALGGGLVRGRLHECLAAEVCDAAGATGFALALARLMGGNAPLLWVRTRAAMRAAGGVYADGLAGLGINPARLLLVVAEDDIGLLRAGLDGVRCAGLGAVVIECWRNPRTLDLTATRRLTLAASASGVTALLLRIDAAPAPSAAETRWSVAASPSQALAANAPGAPAFAVTLLRQRSGPAGLSALWSWDGERGRFDAGPALAGAGLPLVRDRVA